MPPRDPRRPDRVGEAVREEVAAFLARDEQPTVPQGPAPELGQDTELILMDAGLDWDEISAMRETGALG